MGREWGRSGSFSVEEGEEEEEGGWGARTTLPRRPANSATALGPPSCKVCRGVEEGSREQGSRGGGVLESKVGGQGA